MTARKGQGIYRYLPLSRYRFVDQIGFFKNLSLFFLLILTISFSNILFMNPQINLLHLKYFCDSVVYNSISEAAKINFVTQSAVSQAISKLELSLGVSVLVHSRQKFQITEEGQIVFDQAKYIFKSIQDIRDTISQNNKMTTGSIKFVTTKSLGMSFLGSSYKRMQENHPQVGLEFETGGLNFIRNMLKNKNAEFGIVVYDHNFDQFSKYPLKKGRLQLYQSLNTPHHLIEKGIIVDYAQGTYVKELCDQLPIKIQAAVSSWEVVARFTEMGIGVGFCPDFLMMNNRYPTIKPYPMEIPHLDYEICVIHNKGEKLSRAAKAFIDQFSME